MNNNLEKKQYEQNKIITLSNNLDFSRINIDRDLQEFYQQRYTKAITDYKVIDDLIKKITDRELLSVVKNLQLIGVNILFFLNKEPAAIAKAGNFIDYYQSNLVEFMQEFRQLSIILDEKKKKVREDKVKQTINQMLNSYASFYDELLNSKFLDLDISLKVMQQSIDELSLKPITINKAALQENIVLTKDAPISENNNKEKLQYSSKLSIIRLKKLPAEIMLLGIEYILFFICLLGFFLYK